MWVGELDMTPIESSGCDRRAYDVHIENLSKRIDKLVENQESLHRDVGSLRQDLALISVQVTNTGKVLGDHMSDEKAEHSLIYQLQVQAERLDSTMKTMAAEIKLISASLAAINTLVSQGEGARVATKFWVSSVAIGAAVIAALVTAWEWVKAH